MRSVDDKVQVEESHAGTGEFLDEAPWLRGQPTARCGNCPEISSAVGLPRLESLGTRSFETRLDGVTLDLVAVW
jgi:hypothetical protein